MRSWADFLAVPTLHHEGTLWRSFTNARVVVVAAWHQAELVLGGSGVVMSGVIRPLTWVISIVTLLITVLITTHEPPSIDKVTA